jgi:DNA-binding protein YbaB
VQPQEHPQATAVMDEFKKFSDVLEGALKNRGTGSFTAKDESETVEVIINGDMCVTHVLIEDGLLRLGAETVEERINEALMKASAEAAASIEADQVATFEKLAGIVDSLQKITGDE